MMSVTITQARDDVLTLLNAVWTASVVPLDFQPLVWDDNPQNVPSGVDGSGNVKNWGRATLRHFSRKQASLSNEGGVRRYRSLGLLTVQVFARQAIGKTLIDSASQVIIEALQGKTTTNGVVFNSVQMNEVGQDGPWFNANVLANFEYDQVI